LTTEHYAWFNSTFWLPQAPPVHILLLDISTYSATFSLSLGTKKETMGQDCLEQFPIPEHEGLG